MKASTTVPGRLVISWEKDSLADGYVLQYSTDKNFATSVETEIFENADTTSKTLSDLQEGKTYYVRVASYVTVDDENHFGEYSLVNSAKTKKSFAVNSIGKQNYTGTALKPAVKVTSGSKTLTLGTDYTATYTNNIKPGKATVVVKGKGDYAGTVEETFIIIPKKATLTSVTSTTAGVSGSDGTSGVVG